MLFLSSGFCAAIGFLLTASRLANVRIEVGTHFHGRNFPFYIELDVHYVIQLEEPSIKLSTQYYISYHCATNPRFGRGLCTKNISKLPTGMHTTLLIVNILAGDIEQNPGPTIKRGRKPRYPCTMCNYAVKNVDKGMLCSHCNNWSHNSCTGVSDTSYEYHMNNSEVVWFFTTCDLLNIALPDVSLTDSESNNPFHVLSDLKDEAEFDINLTVGTSPAKTSSPKSRTRKTCRQKDIENQNRSRPGETDREKDQNPRGPPQKKQGNVPVVKVFIANFQSIKNKSADFAAFDETERPDVILGCESWLHGNIASAEIFPSHFQVTRKTETPMEVESS